MVWKQGPLSTEGSTLAALLPQFVVPIWTLKFHNVRTVGNEVIYKMCVESKVQNASSVIAPINPFITTNLHGVVKLMKKLTLLG